MQGGECYCQRTYSEIKNRNGWRNSVMVRNQLSQPNQVQKKE